MTLFHLLNVQVMTKTLLNVNQVQVGQVSLVLLASFIICKNPNTYIYVILHVLYIYYSVVMYVYFLYLYMYMHTYININLPMKASNPMERAMKA